MPDIEPSEQEAVTRSFWSGTITFGLVSVPVALYAANRPGGVSLRMVSPEGKPLSRRYFTSRDDRELDADEIVRGYEIEKDRFVLVDDDELERLAPERTRDIDLRQFVELSEIDPMYFERAYYLTPAGQSTKAYRLLARVMEETGRAGIATFVMRAREYLVAIIAENGILRAETLRFADELRTPEAVGLPAPAEPPAAEVRRMDREIGKRMKDRLDLAALEDTSTERMMKVVRAKLRAGEDVVQAPPPAEDDDETSDVIDLMEILKRRLQVEDDTPSVAADTARPARPSRASSPRKSASKSISKSASKSTRKSASKSASKSTGKSAAKSAPKSASRTTAKSASKPTAKRTAKSASRSTAKAKSASKSPGAKSRTRRSA